MWLLQAHELDKKIYDIDMSALDAKTVGEVRSLTFFVPFV